MDDQTKNLIKNHIDNNEVCLFMKGTPDAPQCGFSMAVSNILKILEVNYKGVNVLEDQLLSDGFDWYADSTAFIRLDLALSVARLLEKPARLYVHVVDLNVLVVIISAPAFT